MGARDRFAKIHSQKGNPPAPVQPQAQSTEAPEQPEQAAALEETREQTQPLQPQPETPTPQPDPRPEPTPQVKRGKGGNKTDTPVKQIMRTDVKPDAYGIKPDVTNFNLYNYDLSEFITAFSKQNKKKGGCAITKSQLMETVLDVAFYDMGLQAEGFESIDELRTHLQAKLK